MPIKCLVVDQYTLFREALRRLLEGESDIAVVGEAGDPVEALEKVRQLRPDVVVMDPGKSGVPSLEAARLMRKNSPGTRLLFLTAHEDEEYLRRCLEVGVAGYLLKDATAARLIDAVRGVYQGREFPGPQAAGNLANDFRQGTARRGRSSSLTPREREITKMIAEGNSAKEIAALLGLSVKTVEAHKFNLMRKLNLHNKAQLVTYAIQKKILKMPVGA